MNFKSRKDGSTTYEAAIERDENRRVPGIIGRLMYYGKDILTDPLTVILALVLLVMSIAMPSASASAPSDWDMSPPGGYATNGTPVLDTKLVLEFAPATRFSADEMTERIGGIGFDDFPSGAIGIEIGRLGEETVGEAKFRYGKASVDNAFIQGVALGTVDIDVFEIDLGLRRYFLKKHMIQPYFAGGLSILGMDASASGPGVSNFDISAGAYAQAGFQWQATQSTAVGVGYRHRFGTDTNMGDAGTFDTDAGAVLFSATVSL